MTTECKRMKEPDHLSSLSDDCLFAIFARLDQDDLDQISELSGRLRGTTNRGRKMARKVMAKTIVVTQEGNSRTRKFSFTLTHKEKELRRTVKTTVTNISERMGELKGVVNIGAVDAESELDKLIILINRFSYNQFKFKKVYLTDNFNEFFERISDMHEIDSITFEQGCVVFLENASRKKLLSSILRANPNTFNFNARSKTAISDKSFIRDFAHSIDIEFGRSLTDLSRQKPFLKLDKEEAKGSLAKFMTINLPNMVINKNWIFDMVTTRLRLLKNGKWSFLIDRNITFEELCDAVDKEMDVEMRRGEIKLINDDYYASIETDAIRRNNATLYQFKVDFYFLSA